METRLLVFLALATSVIAGPITQQESAQCSTQCQEATKFKYAPGTTYTYDYRVDTTTSMSGASEDTAKLSLQSTVDIQALSSCEFSLKLRNIRVFHSDGNDGIRAADREEQFRRGLEAFELRFSFQDGIVDNVCADQREERWILNIKKGVLSAFQNSMDDLTSSQNVTEIDVSGSCKSEYKVISSGYYTISIRKSKDILSCTDRNSYKTMLQMVPYTLSSDLQSTPLLKTKHECDQQIEKGGVLKSSTCTESHMYRPFSNGQSGAVTTVQQTLTYQTSNRGVNSRQTPISSRDSLVFDYSATKVSTQQARNDLEEKLRGICDSTSYDIRPESPRLFSELVSAMRNVELQDLEDIHKLLKTKTMCPTNNKTFKLFLDALPMTSNQASVSLMTSLITSGDVKGLEAKAWIVSLAFVQSPTSQMLLDVKTLVENEKVGDAALLPVSSMVYNYCRKTSDCGQDYAVLSIMAAFERNIGYSCDASATELHKVLLTLRAIGNAGHATRSVAIINRCLTSASNPMEIRLAAAQAFRRMPCDAESSDLWTVYENGNLDSELRISAYLALMRCPDDRTLDRMAASLGNEEDDQVGAFVYSHLTNLRETSDPHKQEVASAINNLALEKEFDISPLKFSRNYETSVLINKLNTGFVAESNLVWSNTAQLPRSISANLTVDLFGHAINLVDFGGRLEGMEHLIQNFFGPSKTGQKQEPKKKIGGEADAVQGSLYGRMFGNEVLFLHSKGYATSLGSLPSSWLDTLIKLANKNEFTMTHGVQFIDVSLTVPTAAGLPIHLAVNGSATVDLVLSGKADLRKLGSSPRSLDIDGEFRPSAAMEITGTMSLDAFGITTGLRMRNTLHTSTAMKGRIQLERGQQLNVELDTPQDKIEIFDASSKFFLLHNGMEQEQALITNNRQQFDVCSGNKLAQVTGVELCGHISFPNASMEDEGPYFPLTGPVSASVTLFKRDTHTGYKLFAKRAENKEASIAQLSFNTPGSSVNRGIVMDLTLNYLKQSLDASLATPWKKAAFTGALINSDDMKSISGSLIVDESNTYALTTELKISRSDGKVQLSPMVEIRRPGADNIQLTGFMSLEKPLTFFDMDLSLSGIHKLPYNVKASIANSKKEKSLRGSFSSDGKNEYIVLVSSTSSSAGKKLSSLTSKNLIKVNTPDKQILALDTSLDYKEDKSLKLDCSVDIFRVLQKPASLSITLLKNEKQRGLRYDLDAHLKSTPVSARIDGSISHKSSGLTTSKITVEYSIPRVAANKVVLSGKLSDRSTKAYTKYSFKSNLDIKKNPEYNMALNFDLDHKKKLSEVEVEFRYGDNPKDKSKRVFLSTTLDKKITDMTHAALNYKIKAEAPVYNLDLSVTGKHEHSPTLLDSDIQVNYGKNKDIKAGVSLMDKSAELTAYNGKVIVAWPDREYVLNSQLTQKSAQHFSHEINFSSKEGIKHSISTTYNMPNPNAHEFSTDLAFDGVKPITLSGSTNLNPRNFEAAGEVKIGERAYGLSTKSKISDAPGAKIMVDVYCPERRIKLTVDGGKNKNKYDCYLDVAWDAEKEKSQRITATGSWMPKISSKIISLGGDLEFTSPFQNFKNLGATFKFGSDNRQHDLNGKIFWDGKKNQIVSSVRIMNPVSPRNLEMTFEVETPFDGFRIFSGEIDHKMDKILNTMLKGKWDKDNAKLAIQGGPVGSGSVNGWKGSVAFKSTIKNGEDITLTMSHGLDSGRVSSNSVLNHNGQVYSYDMKTDLPSIKKQSGDLVLITPGQKISTNWRHSISNGNLKSTLLSDIGNDRLYVDLSGSYDLSSHRTLSGVLSIKSPWKQFSDSISLNHKNGYGLIDSNIEWTEDGKRKAFTSINYERNNGKADCKVALTSPWSKDIGGRLNVNYGARPLTTALEFQYEPSSKVTVEGSLNAEAWDNVDLDIKTTTSFRSLPNTAFKASNKREGSDLVSHVNFDYGVRKHVAMESRFAFTDQMKLARVKVVTPFSGFQSLNTGLRLDGQRYNFDASADFELLPVVKKIQASTNLQYNGDLSGKLRLDTPFHGYSYFQVVTTSKNLGSGRESRIEAEHYPGQVYSFVSTYTFELPISFQATINSPLTHLNNLGLSFQYNPSPSSVQTKGQVRYQSDKQIEGDLTVDWTTDIEGNLVFRTPFEDYENSKVTIRHSSTTDSFASHAELSVAQKRITADATFNVGYSTTGIFTFKSFIPGLENIGLNFKKKGYTDNVKASATLTVNGDKIDADLTHRLALNSVKSSLKVSSPYTEELKFSIDHNGMPTSFTNKLAASYGRSYDIDSVATFDYKGSEVNAKGLLKYKLGMSRETAQLSFSKSGLVEDMTFTGTASYNRNDVSVTGSWKNLDGLAASLNMKTPFDDFRNVGVIMTHSGYMNDFKSSANIDYMDGKSINGKIEMKARDLSRIRFSSEISTPFVVFPSASLSFKNEYNYNDQSLDGNAVLTTPVGNFGTGSFAYNKAGGLGNLVFTTNMNMKDKDVLAVKLTNTLLQDELHIMLDLKSALSPNVVLTLDKTGDVDNFNSKAFAMLGRDSFLAEITKSGSLEDLTFSGTAKYNRDAVSVNGSWKSLAGLDGTITIKTPFNNFKNVGLTLSHSGDISDFTTSTSINFMDGQNINGKVEFSADGINKIRFLSNLNTPFTNYESTSISFSNDYNDDTKAVNGNTVVSSSINRFGTASVKYSKTGSLDNLLMQASITKDGQEVSSLKFTNTLQDTEVHTLFSHKCQIFPEILLTFDHNGDMNSFSTKARGLVGSTNVVSGEINLSQTGNNINADGKVIYNTEELGSNQASFTLNKQGQIDDFGVQVVGKYNAQEYTIDSSLKMKDEIIGNVAVTTPHRGYRSVGLSFKHSGNLERFNCEGNINLADEEHYSGKLVYYRSLYRRMEATAELKTPISGYEFSKFEYRHEGESNNFKCYSTVEYGAAQKITYELTTSMQPSPSFSVTIKTPFDNYEDLKASASVENSWPKYGITSMVKTCNGQVITLKAVYDASEDVKGSLALSTPVDGFTNVGLSFQHSGDVSDFSCEGLMTYMDGQEISSKFSFRLRNPALSAEVRTPFSGYEFTKYEYSQNLGNVEASLLSTLTYGNGKVIRCESMLQYQTNPSFTLTLTTPYHNYQQMMVSYSFENSWPKYAVASMINAGNGRIFSLKADFDASSDISGSIKIETPVDSLSNIGMNFIHSGNDQKFISEGKLTYMDGQDITAKVNFHRYLWRRAVAWVELSTPFEGMENSKAEVNYEYTSSSISATAALEYANGQKINGNMKLTYSPNYDVLITLNTPLDDYRVIRAQGTMDFTASGYGMSYSVNYGPSKSYSVKSKLVLYSIDNLDGSLEVTVPVPGFEYTKVEYKHKADSNRFDGSASLTFGNNQIISGDLKSTIYPNFDVTANLKTPFRGYENMQGSTTFTSAYKKYDISSALDMGRGYAFSLISGLDYSADPLRVSTKISTPFEDFRNIEVMTTHEGTLTNFRCSSFFSSPITDSMKTMLSFRYQTAYDMSASASLKSTMYGIDDMKVELQNSDVAGEKKTHAVIGWTQGQQIVLDGTFRQEHSWSENKIHSDVSLSAPFIALRNLAIQLDHNDMQNSFSEKMYIELNGNKLLDMDGEYTFKNKHEATVIFRKPWSMQYTASGSAKDSLVNADILANWNSDDLNSNIRLLAAMTDNSDEFQSNQAVDIGVEHASRKVGVVYKLVSSSQKTTSNGMFYWNSNDASKVSYDMEITDNSRRDREVYDGNFKLGLPSRTLALIGSYSDNQVTKTTDGTFSWDADRDKTKQLGVKAVLTRGDRIKGDLTLSMPYIKKEIRVNGEVSVKNGRVILDTKTDISYSPDSRKTLTLTSKLEDITGYYSNYNYSLELGVSHIYTNVDVRLISHLGSSDDRMTMGIQTHYLTTKREQRNMQLLAEIDSLKKQINLRFFNPMNKIEVTGDIVSTSPYKLSVLNKVNDVEAFRSDLTLDKEKKSMVFNAFVDSDQLTVSALYPNSSAFSADVTHISPVINQNEALLGVRLNTSRLLHTRVHWRPGMLANLRQAILERAALRGLRVQEMLTAANDVFAEELSGKYTAIINDFSEEVRPLINLLKQELDQVAIRLNGLSRDLRAMYERNDFYIQDMGVTSTTYYMELQETLQTISKQYRKAYTKIIQSMTDNLITLTSYPIRDQYSKLVQKGTAWFHDSLQSSLMALESYLASVDAALQEYRKNVLQYKQQVTNTVYNVTYMDYLSNKMDWIKQIDISPYIPSAKLYDTVSTIHNTISSQVSSLIDPFPQLKHIKGGINEIYQQSVWAYNYWQIENNIYRHAQNIATLVKEIAEEELKEYMQNIQALNINPITVWDPQNGEIQADLLLPFEWERLDQLPDVSPLVDTVQELTALYMPDQSTLNNLASAVIDLWPVQRKKVSPEVNDDKESKDDDVNNNAEDDDINNDDGDNDDDDDDDDEVKQLRKYRPSMKHRFFNKGKKVLALSRFL